MINEIVNSINNVLWGEGQILIYLLLFAGFWFSFKLRWIQILHFRYMFKVMKDSTQSDKSGISSFQALCTGLSARVGTGNLAGVAMAISLGGIGLSLHDLVQLYAGLAQGGTGPVLRVDPNAQPQAAGRLVSDVSAWHVGHILAGLTPPPGAPSGAIAYKTGTSYGHRDAWAIGYDGRHVIGVWMGRADGTPVPGAFGGDLAAPVLFEAFGRLKPEFEPLPSPPAATLILSAAELPLPLRRYRPRDAVFSRPVDAPKLVFPPSGSQLLVSGGEVTLKLRGGAAPFTVLANGRPVASGLQTREFEIPYPGKGFSTLVVVDTVGQSDRVTIRVD